MIVAEELKSLRVAGLKCWRDGERCEEWSGVEWSGVEWSGVEWGGVEWSETVVVTNYGYQIQTAEWHETLAYTKHLHYRIENSLG